jgi:hypothetical protein
MLPGEAPPQARLRSGTNRIAIQLTLGKSTYGAMLLDVGLIGYVPPTVDKSVRKVLDEVTSLPPFPEGSTDQTRTFDIDFELKPNRMAG